MIKPPKKTRWTATRNRLTGMHASDASENFMKLAPSSRTAVFRLLPGKFAAKLFAYLDPSERDELLKELTPRQTRRLLALLNPDDRTDVLEDVPLKVRRTLFNLLSPEDKSEARTLLSYPLDSVGREMTPDFIAVQSDWSARKAMAHIRKYGHDKETVDNIFITDEKGKLSGSIQLKHLIFASEKAKVADIAAGKMKTGSISAFADKEKAVQLIKKLNTVTLPVTDGEGNLIGIVTIDDLLDIQEEEVTEDFQKMGAVSVGEGGDLSLTNIVDAPVGLLYRKRIPWLMILVFMNVFSGAAIALYEGIIAKAVALVFFLPLLIASGGNAGAQSAMLMVRSLGTGDVKMSDWVRLMGKEFLVAGVLGVTMAAGVSLIGWIRGGVIIGMIVAISMMAIVVAGSLIGLLLPFIFTKFKKDPATASGPLVTSIADICGVLIYFSVAKWLLGL